MKRLPLFCLLASSMVGLHAETWIDNARVRRVDPQYENVSVPRNQCSRQLVSQAQPVSSGYGDGYGYANGSGGERQYGGAVIGGVAGALLGNQIGRGHGREAATALGAVVGAFAGDQYANRGNQYANQGYQGRAVQYVDVPREVTSCRTVSDVQSRVTGYRVQYEYHGQSYTTFSHVDPGPNLQVRVSVEPVVR